MTVILFHNEIELGNRSQATFYYEKYWERGFAKPLWRYGYINKDTGCACLLKSHLLSRPNLKRLQY